MTLPDDSIPKGSNGSDHVRREHRAPALVAVLVTMALPFLVPKELVPGPKWILPAGEAVLLSVMVVVDPGRIDRRSNRVRGLRIALIGFLVVGATWGTARLVTDLINGGAITNAAGPLLAGGSLVWIYVVITFGFLYWELDSGGPGQRANRADPYPDLAFPQHLTPELSPPGWRPIFVDYLYLAFTGAIALSPTDVMPLVSWAKMAMTIEALVSLAIIGLVIARAVNVFG